MTFSREDVENALTDAGIDTRIRGEALGLQEFAEISNYLVKIDK